MKRKLLWLLGCLFLAGCTESEMPLPNARIVPSAGLVPYEATIKVDPIADTYIFRLPDRTVTQDEPQLDIVVDRITYPVEVECIMDEQSVVASAMAIGTNAAPIITALRINGSNDRWLLKPFERTLIQPVVSHSGDWTLVSLEASGEIKPGPYSVFHPPYEAGVQHAEWHGQVWENAAIIYPLYLSVESHNGLPYTPTGFDMGYPTSYKRTNQYEFGSSGSDDTVIPAQTGTIRVTVRDEFGRNVSKTFEIPISAGGFTQL